MKIKASSSAGIEMKIKANSFAGMNKEIINYVV